MFVSEWHSSNVCLQCVVCMSAKATMETQPCGHRVVCRLCFVKTIQTAVAQRVLPLRCVVCRTKILKLKQSTPPLSSTTPARCRGVIQARASRHGASSTGAALTSALSPRHSANGGSKLMQPLPIYPALGISDGGTAGRSAASSASGSCHHHHLPLHHQTVQRRAMTAWTSSVTLQPTTTPTPLVMPDRDGSQAKPASTFTGVAATCGRIGRRSTSSSATGHVDSPRRTAPAVTSRGTGHDTKRIQRLKWYRTKSRM